MILKINSIRELNTTSVLNYIINNQPISRARISKDIKMNKANISEITRELINSKLIMESGTGKSTTLGGRKPILLTFNHKAGVAIGIDLGVNSFRYIITYLDGEVIFKSKLDYNYDKAKEIISEILNKANKKYSKLPYGVVGATISVQGIVDNNQIFFTPNYNISNIENIQDNFKFPIYFENEANLAAYSHMFLDKSKLHGNVAAITLRSGIGSGIINEQTIYKGEASGAGELGHTIIVPNGISCSCGNKGCLEQYASERKIVKEFRSHMNQNDLTIEDFIKEYNNNNQIAIDILDKASEYLAIGINNFVALLAINEIYLVGNLSDQIPSLSTKIKENIHSVFASDILLVNSPYGKFASAMGACFNGIDNFVNGFVV